MFHAAKSGEAGERGDEESGACDGGIGQGSARVDAEEERMDDADHLGSAEVVQLLEPQQFNHTADRQCRKALVL